MRRNKIKDGWSAIPAKPREFKKSTISWSTKYEIKYLNEDTFASKIIKFIIRISLWFAFNRKEATKSKLNLTVNNTYDILSSNKFKFIPSSVAFYLFLSIIPIFVISTSLVWVFDETWFQFLKENILNQLIPGVSGMFNTIDFKTTEIIITAIFIISSIWFASKGINKFRDSFTELYGFEDKQNFIVKRIKSVFVVILVSIYFTALALCYIPVIKLLKTHISNVALYETLFYLITFVYMLFFGYVGIGMLYKYISPIRIKWSYLNLGILVSLIPTIIFVLLFSTITKYIDYGKFGVIGSFVYLLLFVLYISYFLHAGIIINSSYYKANVFQNIVVRRSFISKKIVLIAKNIYWRIKLIKFNRRN